jgi:cytoskeletal protein CcmA (bactofilin family)
MSGEERMSEYEKKLRKTAVPTTHVSGSGRVHIEGIGDIHISGSGYVSPEEIKISGSGSLPGGIKSGRIVCGGSVLIEGDAEAEEMCFSGSGSIAGNAEAKVLSASGSLSIGEGVKGSSMKVAGSVKVGNRIELEDALRVHGSLRVLGDVEARNMVELYGRFDVNGKIVAETFEAELSRQESHVRNGIEASNVSVKKKGVEGLVLFGIPIIGRIVRDGKLYTTHIVAKERVYLENVCCDNVSGKDVTIGERCIIKGTVKYSDTVSVHPTAKLSNPPIKSC